MLTRSIVHKCGHIEAHSFEAHLFDRVSKAEIERSIADLAQQPCANCMNKQRGTITDQKMKSDNTATLGDLKDQVKKFIGDRDWVKYHKPKDIAVSIAIEASELLEVFQWVQDKELSKVTGDPKKLEKMEEELADIIIYCLSFANVLRIDITKAVAEKIKQNEDKYPIEKVKGNYIKYSDI